MVLPSAPVSFAATVAVVPMMSRGQPRLPKGRPSAYARDRQSAGVGAVDVIVGSRRTHERRARRVDVLLQRKEIGLRMSGRRPEGRQSREKDRRPFHANWSHPRYKR